VLLTVRELHVGGIERDVAKLATTLESERFEVHVGTYYPKGLRYEELKTAGIPVLSLPVGALFSRATVAAASALRNYIRQHRIKILHAWDSTAVICVPTARMCGVPVVISSTLGYRKIVDRTTVQFLRMTDRLVDAIVANCEAIRRHLIDDEGVSAQRIEICYNGVNTREFFPLHNNGLDERRQAGLTIGTVAVLRREKGIDVLQDAFARVRNMAPQMKLVIVGSGPELARLQNKRDQLDLGEACELIPATADVARWLRAMDIFVLPSHSEAFSNSMLEAMACGCACVGTRVGGTPELLGDDERGLLCRPGDPIDLAEKLARFINDSSLRKRVGACAAAFASQRLSLETATNRMCDIYSKLLSRNCESRNRPIVFGKQ
jgi:glycosyltransferase involved in cell wall biosynthesis